MGCVITRKQHNRDALRYPGDLADGERQIVAAGIPPAKPGGRPRSTAMRQVVNAILCISGGGIQ